MIRGDGCWATMGVQGTSRLTMRSFGVFTINCTWREENFRADAIAKLRGLHGEFLKDFLQQPMKIKWLLFGNFGFSFSKHEIKTIPCDFLSF